MFENKFPLCLATATVLAAGSASADVTARDVWDGWKAMSAFTGQVMTAGGEETEGNALVLNDVTTTMEVEGQKTVSTLDWIRMEELGDGTVEVTLSPEQRVTGEMQTEPGKSGKYVMTLTYNDAKILASGTPERMVQDYTVGSMTLSQGDITVEGEAIPMKIGFTANDLTGSYVTENTEDAKLRMTGDGTAEDMTLRIEGTDPQNGAEFMIDVAATGVGAEFAGDMVNMVAGANPFASGASFDIDLDFESVTSVMDVDEDGETVHIEGTGGAATLDMAISADQISYATTSEGVNYKFSSSEIPLPDLTASIDSSEGKLVFPTSKSDIAEDFEFLVSMKGLSLDDRLWLMMDPGNVLDHGPASLIIDMTGKVKMLVDVLSDPESLEDPEGEFGELEALTLRDLQLTVAGAELTGAGDFTFDSTKTEMLDGFPQPSGAVNLKLVGGNTLLDNLVKMGLVPEDQVMGVRMMMAMFAVPGDAPDTMTSKIEFTDEGKILANGQPLN